jgi:hypothetical protein
MGTPGTQRIKNYGADFKLKAVQLSNQHAVTKLPKTAQALLGRWATLPGPIE